MSFYRTVLAAVAAVAIASPVFADDSASAAQAPADNNAAVQTSDNSSQPSTSEQIKVNLNKASAKELAKVKGLNASKARSIIAYRKKHGDFKSIDELSNVKGLKKLSPESLKAIEDQLTIE